MVQRLLIGWLMKQQNAGDRGIRAGIRDRFGGASGSAGCGWDNGSGAGNLIDKILSAGAFGASGEDCRDGRGGDE